MTPVEFRFDLARKGNAVRLTREFVPQIFDEQKLLCEGKIAQRGGGRRIHARNLLPEPG